MIKAVVFDMDGVLCRYRIARRLALLSSWSGQNPEAIHAAIWRSGFEDEAERGVVSADDYLRGFGERMGHPLSAAQWVEARRVAIEPTWPCCGWRDSSARIVRLGCSPTTRCC